MTYGNFFLLLIIPLLHFSCKKPRDGQTKAEGQVVDQHTNAAVADATVNLMQRKINSVNASYSLVESWQADAEGRFSANFEGNEGYDYILMASTHLGHYTSWQNAPSVTSGLKNKDVKIPVQAPAWLKIKIANVPPPDWAIVKLTECGISGVCDLINPSDTTIILSSGLSNQNFKYFWAIKNANGTETLHYKDIFLAGLDTTLVEINY